MKHNCNESGDVVTCVHVTNGGPVEVMLSGENGAVEFAVCAFCADAIDSEKDEAKRDSVTLCRGCASQYGIPPFLPGKERFWTLQPQSFELKCLNDSNAVCAEPGCGVACDGPFCAKHAEDNYRKEHRREYDRVRKSETDLPDVHGPAFRMGEIQDGVYLARQRNLSASRRRRAMHPARRDSPSRHLAENQTRPVHGSIERSRRLL